VTTQLAPALLDALDEEALDWLADRLAERLTSAPYDAEQDQLGVDDADGKDE
jgi:hypothetical protein